MEYNMKLLIERSAKIKDAIEQGLVNAYVNELDGENQGKAAEALNSFVGFDLARYYNKLKQLLAYHSLTEKHANIAGDILKDPHAKLDPNKVDAFERKVKKQDAYDSLLEEISRASFGMQRAA